MLDEPLDAGDGSSCLSLVVQASHAHLDGDEVKIDGCLRLQAGAGGGDSEAPLAEDRSGSDASTLRESQRKKMKKMPAGAASGHGDQEINNDGCNNGISRAISTR